MKTKYIFVILMTLVMLMSCTPVLATPTVTKQADVTAVQNVLTTPLPTLTRAYPTPRTVDANAVAFIDLVGIDSSLWIANVDGSGERKLVKIENNVEWVSDYLLQWSPDGKWIGYISGDDLWIISPDGLVKRKILSIQDTNNKIIRAYRWSPDSSKVAYAQAVDWHDMPQIKLGVLDLTTGEFSELSSYQSPASLTLSWSPDGRYLLLSKDYSFIIFDVSARKVVKEIDTRGGECPSGWQSGLEWSPNGKWFYHIHHGTGVFYSVWICVSGLDGSNREIDVHGATSYPVWDNTGNFLYFVLRSDPKLDIDQPLLRYDARTQEIEEILSLGGKISPYTYIWPISISPDGRTLETDSKVSENQQTIILLDIDSLSTTRVNISEIPQIVEAYRDIIWSADGQNLIFLSEGKSRFYKLDIQTGKTAVISSLHSVTYWTISPVLTSP